MANNVEFDAPGSAVPGTLPPGPGLKRALSLPLLVLYGLGVTIGAGIYVLVGIAAGRAGIFAPAAFVVAAIVMAFSGSSFAELSRRFPVSAGEAAYVREGLRSPALSLLVGLLVAGAGIVSSSAIALGSAGYLHDLTGLPSGVLVPVLILAMGAIAVWGIFESVLVAGILTLIEIAGLGAIIVAGFWNIPALPLRLTETILLTSDLAVWSGVFGTSLLAFFAFIGFEDMVNLAEEVKDPGRNMPQAIFLTLLLTTLIYFLGPVDIRSCDLA